MNELSAIQICLFTLLVTNTNTFKKLPNSVLSRPHHSMQMQAIDTD